jgi:aconitate hydratase
MASRFKRRWEGEGGAPDTAGRPAEGHHAGRTKTRLFSGHDGSIVIASITSCTNTSNPYVMIGAGLVARKARELGLTRKPWVKTSLAPGSQVVTAYLEAAGLQEDLDAIGFNLVGYGCTTCIGNSGPLQPEISARLPRQRPDRHLGPVGQPQLRGPDQPRCAGQLPRLAAARGGLCAGRRHEHRPANEPLGRTDGKDVYLKDIWPTRPRSPNWSRRP